MIYIWTGRAGFNPLVGEVFKGRELDLNQEQFEKLKGQVKPKPKVKK